jgi:hypothetical protein
MAVFLLLAGAAVWAFSTWAGAGVLAAEVGDGGGRFSRYYGSPWPAEVQLNSDLFDVQVGALLVLGCAVAVLLCRSVRGLGDVVAVLVTLPCVLLVVNAILAHVVGSSLTAAVAGGLVLVVVCVGFAGVASSRFMPSPRQDVSGVSAGRLLLLALTMSAAGAVLVLEGLEPAGWVVEVLPGLVSIPVVQGALVAAMLGLVAVMAVRWTVVVVAAVAVIAVVGGWLVLAPVFTRFDGPWVVALGAVLVMAAATAAVSGSEDPRPGPLTRLLAVAAAAVAFGVGFFPAGYIGVIFEMLAQTFAGGELGADGGPPWLMGGALAGLAGFAGYAAVLMRPNQPVADQPPASPDRGPSYPRPVTAPLTKRA